MTDDNVIALRPRHDRTRWTQLAECRDPSIDPDWFFVEPIDVGRDHHRYILKTVKAICQRCPVRDECLAEAVARREGFGVWGGLTTSERRRLWRRRR